MRKVGMVGCGTIAETYMQNLTKMFSNVVIVSCTDLVKDRRDAVASKYNIKSCTFDEMLADEEIDIILNITTPQAHTAINIAALEAGKHIYCEKPFALNLEDAEKVMTLAEKKGLRVGGAPDLFLGSGIQTCRKLIDDGWLGEVVSATSNYGWPGHEIWHPAPQFYYKEGGGPMLDIGPYHVAALVSLLGPVKRISAFTKKTFEERTISSMPFKGDKIKVDVPTFYTGIMEFASGAICTITQSFETWMSEAPALEIHGTAGSMVCPNPGVWGGQPKIFRGEFMKDMYAKEGSIYSIVANPNHSVYYNQVPVPYHDTDNDMRGWGLADMAAAIDENREHRANERFVYHCLDILLGFEKSSASGKIYELQSTCERPGILPLGLDFGETD